MAIKKQLEKIVKRDQRRKRLIDWALAALEDEWDGQAARDFLRDIKDDDDDDDDDDAENDAD